MLFIAEHTINGRAAALMADPRAHWTRSAGRNGSRLAALIPGARYVEFDGVGHLVPEEAPTRLAEIVNVTSTRTLQELP